MKTLRDIAVFNEHMQPVSPCSQKTAGVLVTRKRAHYLNKAKTAIQITVSSQMIKALKRQIIKEAGRICYICGRYIPLDERATVDHLYPKRIINNNISGLDTKGNMRCCCLECNYHKGNMDINSYIIYRTVILIAVFCVKSGQPITRQMLKRALYGGNHGHKAPKRVAAVNNTTN